MGDSLRWVTYEHSDEVDALEIILDAGVFYVRAYEHSSSETPDQVFVERTWNDAALRCLVCYDAPTNSWTPK
ncbi:MAG: hypothetical protein AB7T59_05370 [Hyphomonadaceae bacterium]